MTQNGKERRLSKRYEVRCDATLTPINHDGISKPALQVTILEIGRTGVLVLTSEVLEVNSEWRLNILKDGYLQHTQPIIVKRVKVTDNDSMCIAGAMFVIEHSVLQLLEIDLETDQTDSMRNFFDEDIQSLEDLFHPVTD